ncbi:MAG TPA: two-component regulator propeller domain-containing protein [Candidatus Hydrogenedentes bacterium]|nr:two-component regulator propeller domain-containing protein [Candidatus Hydrogenedentota bacterium]
MLIHALCLTIVLMTVDNLADADILRGKEITLYNVTPPLLPLAPPRTLPVPVEPFIEHVRNFAILPAPENATAIHVDSEGKLIFATAPRPFLKKDLVVNAQARQGDCTWFATDEGLYVQRPGDKKPVRHEHYGVDGPLATRITALAVDSKSILWVGTPLGLSQRTSQGAWSHLQGRDGLPVENITALAVDRKDQLWIGTDHGAILYNPAAPDRKWFYRAGKRYLPDDHVRSIAISPTGDAVYFLTDAGVGRIDFVQRTLLEKARIIENRVNERHRRLGLVADCVLDDAIDPAAHSIPDQDNDGLWTAYHVAAMSLCYGVTKDEAARASARESMHALYMLQNASGIPGLVARSVLPAGEGSKKGPQWRPTPDGTMYWKSDTSSDEIDGHYLAFYTYYEHIARYDEAEKALLIKQLRALTDYLVKNNYQLIDWDGKRTRWGFWNPEALNENPANYVECGLNSLQMLSFLKVSHYITGDKKYLKHYRKLILDHGYLNNVLLTKKLFPDEVNHSDDQLGFVAWYPILQLEKDPQIRKALCQGVRRHYEAVRPEHSSFYTFVYATVDPHYADIEGAVENLRQILTDRRQWGMMNSHRADVVFSGNPNRFGVHLLTRVLPVDERKFAKWNADPYVPDDQGQPRVEDDGAAYLLPYWMGRFHSFIAEEK